MASLRIVLLCIAAAVFYGEIHDQITAHLCVEYFSIAHPKIIESTEPYRLAIAWGFAATWWVGAFLGCGLAIAARSGKRTPLAASQLVRPIGVLLLVMAACALAAGLTAYVLAQRGSISLTGPLASILSPEKHIWFLVDAWAHGASYLSGFIGGLTLWTLTWRRRAACPDAR